MSPTGVMSNLPLWVYNRSFPYLDYAITRRKSGFLTGADQINMGPLIAMVVNVIGYLAQQESIRDQHSPCLCHERRVCVSECVPILFGRASPQPKSGVEVFGTIASLIRDMRWIVNNYVELAGPKRHGRVVCTNFRPVSGIDIQPDNRPGCAPPKSTAVDRSVQN